MGMPFDFSECKRRLLKELRADHNIITKKIREMQRQNELLKITERLLDTLRNIHP
jgi:hypothetical protein